MHKNLHFYKLKNINLKGKNTQLSAKKKKYSKWTHYNYKILLQSQHQTVNQINKSEWIQPIHFSFLLKLNFILAIQAKFMPCTCETKLRKAKIKVWVKICQANRSNK